MSATTSEAPEIFFVGYNPEEFDAANDRPSKSAELRLHKLSQQVLESSQVSFDQVLIVHDVDAAANHVTAELWAVIGSMSADVPVRHVESPQLHQAGDHPGTQTIEFLLGPNYYNQPIGHTAVYFVMHEELARHYGGHEYDWLYSEADQAPIKPLIRQTPKEYTAPTDTLSPCITTSEELLLHIDPEVPFIIKVDDPHEFDAQLTPIAEYNDLFAKAS